MDTSTNGAGPAFPPAGVGPLDGIRVLDMTRVLSGPHAARILCDMGADVIKVEPPDGDLTRFSNPRVSGIATYFIQQNVGKRNISVDMRTAEGVQLLLDLVQRCDVVIENFRPGVMDRMGLGYDACAAVNRRIVYASINGYGSTGPWRNRRAYATVIGAESGFTKAQGDLRAAATGSANDDAKHDAAPQAPAEYLNDPHSHADVYTGMEAANAVLAALFQRERTGVGQSVEVTMAQTMLYVNEHAHDHLWDGEVSPEWIRSFRPGDYPTLVLGNGESVMISGHPAERGTFDRFLDAMQRPDLLDDERFATVSSRLVHLDDLLAEMRAWALTFDSTDAIEAALAGQGLAMGVMRSVRELADTEWAASSGAIVEVPDRSGSTVRVPNSPWTFSAATTGVTGVPKYRGEDNAAVLHELLGLDAAAIERLGDAGVLSSRVPPGATAGGAGGRGDGVTT